MSWDDHQERPSEVGDNAKKLLRSQVQDLWAAEREVERLETELSDAKARVRNIQEDMIPRTFEEMEIEDGSKVVFDGLTVTVKSSVTATPKAANREAVYDWLEENGHGGLIKRTGIFKTGRDNEKKFKRWVRSIKTYPGTYERKVEPSTLRAFVSEQIAQGEEIPMELFGAHVRRVAKVKSE